MTFEEISWISHDGLSLYARSHGNGDNVVLCLHGLTRNSKDFTDLAQHLVQITGGRWRVIAPDFRGRGRSAHDPHPRNYHPGTYARDVRALADRLRIERFAVVGTSLGGLVAMILADQMPQRLRGVVLNDIGPEIPPAAVKRILSYAGCLPPVRTWEEAAAQARAIYEPALPGQSDEFWRDYIRQSYRENAAGYPEPDIDPAIRQVLTRPPAAVKWVQRLRRVGLLHRIGGMNLDPWDSFRAITMPCLLIRGELSDVLTPEIVRKMQVVKPDLEVVTVPRRGHAPLLDEPEARNAIDAFLARLP